MEENKRINKKQRVYLIIGIVLFLILVLSASYAYFAITSVNNTTTTTVTGTGEELGSPTLTTNTPNLSLNITAALMKRTQRSFYATPSGEGLEIQNIKSSDLKIGNGRYKLATASVSTSDLSYNCTYSFDVSATVNKTITDKSDNEIFVTIFVPNGEMVRYSLYQLLAGTRTVSGTITNLTKGEDQEFYIDSYLYNQAFSEQNDLSDNTYTISVTPKSGTNGFKCEVAKSPVVEGFAKTLIDSNKMVQSGFEGDGYRFLGTGSEGYCLYEDNVSLKKNSDGTCPTLYSGTETSISSGEKYEFKYASECPTNDTNYSYDCTKTITGTVGTRIPANYVCFGTTDKSTCTSNPDKYMYRIIGVFPDEVGNQHVKLLKKTSIGQYAWHSSATDLITWQESDLYKGINGSYFLTNTTYDYMQNNTWRGKIADWRWSSVNMGSIFRGTHIDWSHLNEDSSINEQDSKYTYLYEMNKKGKERMGGLLSFTTSKVGLMNVSDLKMTQPNFDLSWVYWDKQYNDYLYSSWLINDHAGREWTMTTATARRADIPLNAHYLRNTGLISTLAVTTSSNYVRPVFYLNSNVELGSGTGTEADPYILK